MAYSTEVTFHQGTDREFTYTDSLGTLFKAVEQIEAVSSGMGCCRAYINNREVQVRYGKVLGHDGEPLSTNPEWFKIFAKKSAAYG